MGRSQGHDLKRGLGESERTCVHNLYVGRPSPEFSSGGRTTCVAGMVATGGCDLNHSSCWQSTGGRVIRKIVVNRHGAEVIWRSGAGAAFRHFLLRVKDVDHRTERTVGHPDIRDIHRCIHTCCGVVGLAEVGEQQLRLDRESCRSSQIAGSG